MFTHRAAALLLSGGLVVTAVAAVPSATAASPAQVWGPVRTLGRGEGPDLAVDAAGNITVVWTRAGAVLAARRPVGKAWTDPVRIGRGQNPSVVSDRRGAVTATWVTLHRGQTNGVDVSRRPARGSWSLPRTICPPRSAPGYDGTDPDADEGAYGAHRLKLEASPRGAVVATWMWGSSDRNVRLRVQAAYRPAGQAWRAARTLTPAPDEAWDPLVGIDAAGNVVLGYDTGRGIRVQRRTARSGWTSPDAVGLPGELADVAVAAGGAAMLVSSAEAGIEAVNRQPGGHWRPARLISPPRSRPFEPAAVMDSAGDAVVAWGTASRRVRIARRPAAGPWQPSVRIDAATAALSAGPDLAVDGRGDALVTWVTEGRAVARYAPAGHPWSPIRNVVPPSSKYLVLGPAQVLANGDAVVVWELSGQVQVRRMTAR